LEQHHPKPEHVTANGERDKLAFIKVCETLFPTRQTFSSYKQLEQVIKQLLDKWGCKAIVQGKNKLECAFSRRARSKLKDLKPILNDGTKRRYNKGETQKESCQCPFHISYNYVEKDESLPNIFSRVKITSTNFHHTCLLSPQFLCVAKRTGGSCLLPDNAKLKIALAQLRVSPCCDARHLRPLIEKGLPHWHGCDSSYLSNLRQFAFRYWLKHGDEDDADVSSADLKQLKSPASVADEEIDWDDPIIRVNYKKILRKALQ
jgi:hypothetical protein